MDNFNERLREERARLGLTQPVFAERCGISLPSQVRYEKGARYPDGAYFEAAAKAGVDVLYIITGKRDQHLPDRSAPLQGDVKIGDQEYNAIRVFDVDAAAGNGIVPISEASSQQIAFTRSWLMRNDISANLAGLVRVSGDSMTPTIPDGSYVLVDFRGRADWSTPGIYIVRLDDAVMIKRLQVSQDPATNWVALISDNPDHEPIFIREADQATFQAIGRVRAVITSV